MLVALQLQDLAVAADVHVGLSAGLNALTGSTGAGKSLVVQALRWIAGDDVDRDVVRAGADSASAEAVFDLSARPDVCEALDSLGVRVGSDAHLVLRREVRREGRTRALVNGRVGSAALLREITSRLLEMQSQHEQLMLRRASAHAQVLDGLGVDTRIVEAWNTALMDFRDVEQEIEAFTARQQRLREQREVLEYQRRELEGAQLEGNELDALRERVAAQEGGAALVENAADALARLESDEGGALTVLGESLARLKNAPDALTRLVEAREQIEAAVDLLQEAQRGLERFVAGRELDPEALARDQERLALLIDLTRKYSMTEEELVSLHERLQRELGEIGEDGALPAALRTRRDEALTSLADAGTALDRQRRKIARRVQKDAGALLTELGMAGAEIRFDLIPEEDPHSPLRIAGRRVRPASAGPSRVELVVRTNPGERPGPIQNVASGGELSRIGLVLRSLSAKRHGAVVLVLDEVDAGLGADLGPALARRLRALADRGQVLVISHLPAVAAAGDTQLVASKTTEGSRTMSRIESVEGESRVREIQRMLGGENPRSHAMATQLLGARGDVTPTQEESSS